MKFKLGDRVVNKCASDDNPTKRGVFIEYRHRSGRLNPGTWCRYMWAEGRFAETAPQNLMLEDSGA